LTYFANHWSTLETCQQFGEKDFNSLSQKWGARIELATKPKDGMANRLLVNS
jgi:hypothetical protein